MSTKIPQKRELSAIYSGRIFWSTRWEAHIRVDGLRDGKYHGTFLTTPKNPSARGYICAGDEYQIIDVSTLAPSVRLVDEGCDCDAQ